MPRSPENFFDGWDDAKAKAKAESSANYGAKVLAKLYPAIPVKLRKDGGVNLFQEVFRRTGDSALDEMTAFKADEKLQNLLKGLFKTELWKKFTSRLEESGNAAIVFNIVGCGDWVIHARGKWRKPDPGHPMITYSGSEGGTVVIQEIAQLTGERPG